MVINKRSVDWLLQDDKKHVNNLITNIYDSIEKGKLKLIKAQMCFITQISQHLHKHLLELQCHIQLFNRLKAITFTNNDIFNYLVKMIKNIVINNPGAEVAVAELLVENIELLARRKEAILEMFYVDTIGI